MGTGPTPASERCGCTRSVLTSHQPTGMKARGVSLHRSQTCLRALEGISIPQPELSTLWAASRRFQRIPLPLQVGLAPTRVLPSLAPALGAFSAALPQHPG